MRKIRRLLSMFLTIAMAVSLLDVTAFGLRLNIYGSSVSAELKQDEEGTLLSASYDTETGQMYHVTSPDNGQVSLNDDDTKAMLLDSATYAPKAEAIHSYYENGNRVIEFGSSDVRVDGGFSERYSLVGTGTVYLNRVNDCDVTLNGVQIGGAHVFGYEQPYGVYIQSLNGTVDADDMSVTLYAGQWDENNRVTVFGDPVDPGVFDKSDKEDKTGVHLTVKDEDAHRNWIDDPYQVKLELTFTGTNGKTATVVYDTLWYKEGQMGIADFAARVREKVGDSWACVTETDKDRVKNGWSEEDYNDRLDDFAFAVTRGNLTQPDENNNWNTDATHYRNALDDVRYGTAKTILESVYAAAWNDSTHTALPDSVKLIDDWNREWHGDDDTIPHREIDQMINALLEALPQKESAVSKITIRKAADDWGYVLFDDADDTESNRVDANLRGMAFANNVTIRLGEGMNDGWISFANCSFAQGATIDAPAQQNGRLQVNLNSGTALGAGKTIALQGNGRVSMNISDTQGLALEAQSVCFDVNLDRGQSVVFNGVTYSASATSGANINTDFEGENNELYTVRANGEDYWQNEDWKEGDEGKPNNLDEALTISGTLTNRLRIDGVIAVSGLTVDESGKLELSGDRRSYVMLGGKTISVYDNTDDDQFFVGSGTIKVENSLAELHVNDVSVRAGFDHRDNEGFNLRISDDYLNASSFAVYYNGEPITIDEEQIRHNEEEHEYTGVWFDWERLGENFDDNKLTLTVTAGEATVVYTRIQGEWNRMCDLTDFGNSLRDRLKDNGWSTEFAGYYEPCNDDALTGFYTDAMGRLAAVWPEKRWLESDGVSKDDLWRGDNYDDRLALALVVDLLLGTEPTKEQIAVFVEEYNDPDRSITWGDAKTALTKVLSKLGKTNAVFSDGGWLDENNVLHDAWHDDYGLNQGGKDDLLDQLERIMEQVSTVGELVAALSKGERASVGGDLMLNTGSLNGLEGSALIGDATDGYTLTVPAGVELRIDEKATLTVGENVTLALADGSAIDQNGEPVTEAGQYVWQMSDWGDRYVDNNGAQLKNDGGTLKIEAGGTVRAGRWSNIFNDNNGTVEVFGTLALADSSAHVTGYWNDDGFQARGWDDERGGEDWIDQTDAAQFHNNGELRIGTQDDPTGTMVIGKDANLFNNWDNRGTETDATDDVNFTVTVDGTIELAGGIENQGEFTLYSAGKIKPNGDSARICNNVDERWEDGAEEPYFTHSGTMSLGLGTIELAKDASVEIERTAFMLNGLTFAPGEGYSNIRVTREKSDGATYTLVAEYRGENAMIVTGSDWANELILYGNVDAGGVTKDGGSVINKTAFVSTENALIALVTGNQIDVKTGYSDVIVVGSITLTSDLTLPECYFEIAGAASLTVAKDKTLTFANGLALDMAGNPVVLTNDSSADDLANLAWRENDDGYEVANTGSFIQNNGTLTVDGTLSLGACAFLSNNGEMTVNGLMTLADSTYFIEGHKTAEGITIDNNSEGKGGFTLTDAAGLFNSGKLTVNGTLTGADNGYIGNGGELNVNQGGVLTNKGMLAIMGALKNGGTVNNNALCYVSGQVENEGDWTQSGKLTLEGFGMFGQYDAIGTVAFDNDAAFETIGDATFYVVVRENAGLGTINEVSEDTLSSIIEHSENDDDNVKTMALVLTANGIAAANGKYDDCILVPQYNSKTTLNGAVSFDSVGIEKDVTLRLGESASLTANKLLGEGTIIVQTQDQVICNTEKISENIKIETQAPMSAAGG